MQNGIKPDHETESHRNCLASVADMVDIADLDPTYVIWMSLLTAWPNE